LADRGLLLVQGQGEVPSVADLLAGRAITARGFGWDYVLAWNVAEALAARPDVAMIRLVGGRRTLVAQRFWAAIEALARHNSATVTAGRATEAHTAMLRLIAENPGIPGASIKLTLGIDDTRRFQALKNDLLAWCCVFQVEQDEAESHTHDAAWHPWVAGKIARGAGDSASIEPAVATLTQAVLGSPTPIDARVRKVIPLLRWS
jgi:hypothetical protein